MSDRIMMQFYLRFRNLDFKYSMLTEYALKSLTVVITNAVTASWTDSLTYLPRHWTIDDCDDVCASEVDDSSVIMQRNPVDSKLLS
ncbi:hypothetical protein EVAR_76842_1 [Eumeta japonica]|uniref:Uncharacterized protein n=1 Tax=Eumeta variegata TaxID=151549 RepID=A0A4C1Z0W8_EUMVA|nr:hypothetical protein EVAR_76842_1 [Eumeta japonica]